MSITKSFNDENEEQSIDCFPTVDRNVRFRFLKFGSCEFFIDLDIQTAEALMDEIHLSLSQLEGGEDVIH